MKSLTVLPSMQTIANDRSHRIEGPVPCGFPSPAADYEQAPLDLNRYLVANAPATFFVRAFGASMTEAGIHGDDLLVVDRSREPSDKSVVIAILNGEMKVRRLRLHRHMIYLETEHEDCPDSVVVPEDDFQVWGVVTYVIRAL